MKEFMMKRLIVLISLLTCMNFVVFAQEDTGEEKIATSWDSVGFSWGHYFNSGTDIGDFSFGSPGIDFSEYGFYNQKNIGSFINVGLMFPVVDTIENGYSPKVQMDVIFGVGFRHKIKENLNLHFGVGPNVNMYGLKTVGSSEVRFSLGIGGDIGFKKDLTDSIYIDFGSKLSYDFVTFRVVKSANYYGGTDTKRKWITNSFFGIRPYIALGFNMYQYQKISKTKMGKPKFE
jgi:hypothetical protein